MTPITHTLANIGLKPTTTARDMLTIARRIVRRLCEVRRANHEAQRALRRLAAIRREHLPFTRHNVEELERLADEHRAKLEATRAVLVGYGRLILLDQCGYAESLGFEALADLLNINRADRERARREGWHTLSDLVAIHDLENSAERRGDRWGDGSPLYQACQLALVEFMRTCPEHLLPDPFAPGAPFGPRLPPVLRIV
ncbi:hypothetical protein KRX52_07795 [Pseudomonas sp. MAP12]|uniref:Uncharacterized protein n=1 Tax=Geopseudomonas aromaticivorans TaxID=2849492 RepID=A0ABS6MV64_9GAMM|nr:hypothetical protein [Pseudomonas aromaticivorans]MBV2132706.1 hypothetical protein [Pseudomonas aromaticivorans]